MTTASPSAASRWAGPRPGNSPSTIPIAGSPPIPAPASAKRPSSSRSFSRRTCKPTWWEQAALELVRLPRLVRQPAALPHRRLQRRDRPPEAGRRRDGKGPRRRRHRAGAHHRPENGPRDPSAVEDRNRAAAEIAGPQRPRLAAARSGIRDLHAPLQPLHWLTVDGLAEHWTQARVSAALRRERSRRSTPKASPT